MRPYATSAHRDRGGIGPHVIGKVVPRERETVRWERQTDERGREFSWAPRERETRVRWERETRCERERVQLVLSTLSGVYFFDTVHVCSASTSGASFHLLTMHRTSPRPEHLHIRSLQIAEINLIDVYFYCFSRDTARVDSWF
jgi:hypothetical protein